jgi:hypothetical protein
MSSPLVVATKSGSLGGRKPSVLTALLCLAQASQLCYELKANKASHYPGWKSVFAAPATACQGLGTSQIDLEPVAAKLVDKTAPFTQNYWSSLSCLVIEQKETLEMDTTISVDMAMTTTTVTSLVNKVAEHWA